MNQLNISKKLLIYIGLAVMLTSCDDVLQQENISLLISRKPFTIKVPALGELEAAKATNISMPTSVFEPQVIEWLAEENTPVKKGQVVARFDSKKYQHQSQQEQFQIDKSSIGYQTKKQVLLNEKGEILSEKGLIIEELDIASQYSVDDLEVYSRNQIIDDMRNQEYLEAKRDYTGWRGESHDEKSASELELLRLQQWQHEAKLNMYASALEQLEVRAPHDGLFVLSKNWRGEKPRVGDSTWPGRKIASLPDLSKLQARVFILESEAAGVKVGQRVELILDAYPDQLISGVLEQLDSIAKPKENGSPVKYFEAVVAIEDAKQDYWRPGSQLQAVIYAAELEQVVSIPSQALFFKEGKYFVQVDEGNKWANREVTVGLRSTAKTQILSGLDVGERVALLGKTNEKGEQVGVH